MLFKISYFYFFAALDFVTTYNAATRWLQEFTYYLDKGVHESLNICKSSLSSLCFIRK